MKLSDDNYAKHSKIYYSYKDIVLKTIVEKNTEKLESITQNYFNKINKKPSVIVVYKLSSDGQWERLFYWAAPKKQIKLPKIHYAFSETVHINKFKDYILLETNRNTDGNYDDNIYIKMAIEID